MRRIVLMQIVSTISNLVTLVKLRRRTVEDSISDLESPGQAGASRDKQSPSSGWTFTVTVTPTGILLSLSLIVNITLVSLWYSN